VNRNRPPVRSRVLAAPVAGFLWALLLLGGLPTPAAAFEYDEHCRASNLALRAALRAVAG
jgi:hypothetical protein